MRKFSFMLGYKDQVSQLTSHSYTSGFATMGAVSALVEGKYWWAAFDAAAALLFFIWTKQTAKELRGE